MKKKLLGIFVCSLLITTGVLPVMGQFVTQFADTTKHASYESFNDAVFDRKISFLMRIAGYPSLPLLLPVSSRTIR